MQKSRLLKQLEEEKIIVNLCNHSCREAQDMTEALVQAGVHFASVDMQAENGEVILKSLCDAYPQIHLGANRCLDIFMIEKAVNAGAVFVISSHFSRSMAAFCHRRGILMIPSIQTTLEAVRSLETGMDLVRYFPLDAQQSQHLQAYQSLFPPLKIIVKSELGAHHLKHWLESGAFALEFSEHETQFKDFNDTFTKSEHLLEIVSQWREKNGS